jgi:hypothetical protein
VGVEDRQRLGESMDVANPAVFADVFAPVEVLAPATRRRLAELVVAPPGRAPVIFAADLADAPLPAAAAARRLLGATVAGGLTAGVLACLGVVRIGDLVPTLASVAEPVGARPLAPRAGRHLAERDVTAWSAVGPAVVAKWTMRRGASSSQVSVRWTLYPTHSVARLRL